MRALLLTVGSQGDVQPFVALASRLRSAGHEAVLAAPAVYQGLAGDVPFVPLGLDMNEVGQAVAGRHGLRHVLAFTRAMGQRARYVLPAVTATARDGADIVVHHPVLPIGQHLAELLGVPAVVAPPMPALVPTGEFLSPAWPFNTRKVIPKTINRASYRAARYLTGAWCRRDIDAWRHDTLALEPGHHDPLGPQTTVLHSFSTHVLPRPADWPATAHITGYWFRDTSKDKDWTPPRRLAEFLDGQERPVYIGFGSMPVDDPVKVAAAITMAVQQTGLRAVVFSLSPDLRRLLTQEQVLVVRQAPHEWLFPRMAAIVHHGGAGTTGAAAAAGKPQVIWPFGIDQHFWAARMASLGVAVPPLPVRALTGRTLAGALDRATNDQLISDLAVQLGRRVQAEDGTGCAVAHLESLAPARTAVPA
jgi:sterol 3beta-glucosyltransferase